MSDKYEVGPGFYVKVDLLDTSDATKEVLRKIAESGDFRFWAKIVDDDDESLGTLYNYIDAKFPSLDADLYDIEDFFRENRTLNAKFVSLFARNKNDIKRKITDFIMDADNSTSKELINMDFDEVTVSYVYDPQFDYEDTA